MEFFLGAHHTVWLTREARLFVSRRRLTDMKKLPVAIGPWALDSGGFTELNLFGQWMTTEDEYVADVERYRDEIGNLEWVAPMDWMCEPFVLGKTGHSVEGHQVLTVDNFLRLRQRLGALVIPVLQGYAQDDYHRCCDRYERAGVDLEEEPLVGVGSVCRRQDTNEAARIFHSLAGLSLHGFGVKVSGLAVYGDALTSADSMAWSFEARRIKRRFDRQESLFAWPKQMLCGRVHPEDHRAASCSNCLEWAVIWRQRILDNHLEVVAA